MAKEGIHSFEGFHKDQDCTGRFEPKIIYNAVYSQSALGPLRSPVVPMLVCHVCRTGFLAPGFREWLEPKIAKYLVLHKGLCSKSHVRFLRQYLGLTQEELARILRISDKFELSKMESPNNERKLSEDKQLRLKLVIARAIGIKDASILYEINECFKEREIEIRLEEIIDKKEIEEEFGPKSELA